jgi:hypothetical protein
MPFCCRCGARNTENASFCVGCGEAITKLQPTNETSPHLGPPPVRGPYGYVTEVKNRVDEMRLAGIDSIEAANHFLETRFIPEWEQRFTVAARNPRNVHRRLGREQHLEEILSVRVARRVAQDHTVSWDGNRWGVLREEVCAGLRGAAVEIERRLDGSHWLRYRGRYLHLRPCPEPERRSASPSGLRPPGLAEQTPRPQNKPKPQYHVPADHPWRDHGSGHFYLAKTRTFLLCVDSVGAVKRCEHTHRRLKHSPYTKSKEMPVCCARGRRLVRRSGAAPSAGSAGCPEYVESSPAVSPRVHQGDTHRRLEGPRR